MPLIPNTVASFVALLLAINGVYDYLRLTYPIAHTDRYIDSRPGDALMLDGLTLLLVVIGIPVVGVMWVFGAISLAHAGLAAGILFLSPPALTIGYLEIVGLLYRR